MSALSRLLTALCLCCLMTGLPDGSEIIFVTDLHSCSYGGAAVGGCYQSAPLLFDQDGDTLPDVVVSTWFDNKVRAFSGRDGSLNWEATIGDWTYHAGSCGDLNGDGTPDVAVGDYSATLWAINGRNGHILWSRPVAGEPYIFGPTAMGDLDSDCRLDIVTAGNRITCFDADGVPGLTFALPASCTRGPLLVDFDGDGRPDILVATGAPSIHVYSGRTGAELFAHAFSPTPETDMDFQPVAADLDGNGIRDVFGVYGRGYYDTRNQNWGKAAALILGGDGPDWPTFGHDHHHSGNFHYPAGAGVNIHNGDLNVDHTVDVTDLVILAHAPAGNLPPGALPFGAPALVADVDEDGSLTAGDLQALSYALTR